MSVSTCSFCSPVRLIEAELHFACPICGRRMLLVEGYDVDHLYHCPRHCASLAPSTIQLAVARTLRN